MRVIREGMGTRFLSTASLFALLLVLKWLTSGGWQFNSELWDLEITMFEELEDSDFLDYLLTRDTAGYLIIPIRLIIWTVGFLVPEPHWAIVTRLVVITLQIFCLFLATRILLGTIKTTLQHLALICLVLIPMEDLNYLHHVGYLFYFPSIFLLIKMSGFRIWQQALSIFFITMLQNKPLTSLLLVGFLISQIINDIRKREFRRDSVVQRFLVLAFLATYLAIYVALPRTLELPLQNPFTHFAKSVTNFGYLVSIEILPVFSIGLIGLFRMNNMQDQLHLTGIVCSIVGNVFFLGIVIRSRFIYRTLSPAQKTLAITLTPQLVLSYMMVYTIGNFYWITVSPLWDLPIPSHVWMRWSAIFGVYAFLFFTFIMLYKKTDPVNVPVKTPSLSNSIGLLFLLTVISQYLALWIFANHHLQRWWSFIT